MFSIYQFLSHIKYLICMIRTKLIAYSFFNYLNFLGMMIYCTVKHHVTYYKRFNNVLFLQFNIWNCNAIFKYILYYCIQIFKMFLHFCLICIGNIKPFLFTFFYTLWIIIILGRLFLWFYFNFDCFIVNLSIIFYQLKVI